MIVIKTEVKRRKRDAAEVEVNHLLDPDLVIETRRVAEEEDLQTQIKTETVDVETDPVTKDPEADPDLVTRNRAKDQGRGRVLRGNTRRNVIKLLLSIN